MKIWGEKKLENLENRAFEKWKKKKIQTNEKQDIGTKGNMEFVDKMDIGWKNRNMLGKKIWKRKVSQELSKREFGEKEIGNGTS